MINYIKIEYNKHGTYYYFRVGVEGVRIIEYEKNPKYNTIDIKIKYETKTETYLFNEQEVIYIFLLS